MQIKKIIILLFLSILVIFNVSCWKQFVKSVGTTLIYNNKILLHKNPRVGDYAIYKNYYENAINTMTRKIIKVENNRITMTVEQNSSDDQRLNDLYWEIITDPSGNVIDMYQIDKEDNSRAQLKIAKQPGEGFIKEYANTFGIAGSSIQIPGKITVPAGTFTVSTKSKFTQEKYTISEIDYLINDKVPFLEVYSYHYTKINHHTEWMPTCFTYELVEYSTKSSLVTAEDEKRKKDSGYRFIGTVNSVSPREIVIGGSRVAEMIQMGDRLTVFTDNEAIILDATFPMQTIVKCKILSGAAAKLKKGDKAYKIIKESKLKK